MFFIGLTLMAAWCLVSIQCYRKARKIFVSTAYVSEVRTYVASENKSDSGLELEMN